MTCPLRDSVAQKLPNSFKDFNDSKLAIALCRENHWKNVLGSNFSQVQHRSEAHHGNALTCSKFCQVIVFPGSSKLLTTVAKLWTSSSELMFPWLALLYSASLTRIFTDTKRSPPYICDGLVVSFVIGCVAFTSPERTSRKRVFDW